MYLTTNALVYVVPILISIVNYAAKTILRALSNLEKRHSITEKMYSSAINVAIISFINIGLLVLLVNINIKQTLPIPIF